MSENHAIKAVRENTRRQLERERRQRNDRPTLPLNADEWQIAETWDAKPPEGWRDRHDVFLVQVCAAANEEMGHALGFLWARKRTGKGE